MSGQRVGYQRVSSLEQNPARQLEGIPLDQTFIDRLSGKDVDRPQLTEMLRFVRAGDVVTVHSLDRLARNLVDLRRIVSDLTGRGVRGGVRQGAADVYRRGQRDGAVRAPATPGGDATPGSLGRVR